MNTQTKNLASYIIAIIFIILIIFLINGGTGNKIDDKKTPSISAITILENNFDLGIIPIDGGLVNKNFIIKNTGTKSVIISKASTSCMCTKVILQTKNGRSFGPFGMPGHSGSANFENIEILSGEELTATAIFDPMAHGPEAVGKMTRQIYLETNVKESPILTLKFSGDVQKTPKITGVSLYIPKKEEDFGIIKQSQGVVKKQFEVINNGSEKVIISSLPTSCACTTAEIDKKELNPGEKGIVTVSFDPNLHQEPEGRFFKTIELVSNVKPTPEIKVYIEMNYDLGLDKLKLQDKDTNHKD